VAVATVTGHSLVTARMTTVHPGQGVRRGAL